jgi:hypothetical protein
MPACGSDRVLLWVFPRVAEELLVEMPERALGVRRLRASADCGRGRNSGVPLPRLARRRRPVVSPPKGAHLGEAGGRVILDVNFAYRPSCSSDPPWSCPLPPREELADPSDTSRERLRD